MTLTEIPAGTSVFVDANIFVFALTNHTVHGAACNLFLDRAENQEITAITSAHILGEVVHRLMTIEAANCLGWPVPGIANRLRWVQDKYFTGHDDQDASLPPPGRGCAGRFVHLEAVLGRTCQ